MERELEFLDFFGFYEIFCFGRKISKSEVLGIRDPAFKQKFELSFFAILIFYEFLWRPNCRKIRFIDFSFHRLLKMT